MKILTIIVLLLLSSCNLDLRLHNENNINNKSWRIYSQSWIIYSSWITSKYIIDKIKIHNELKEWIDKIDYNTIKKLLIDKEKNQNSMNYILGQNLLFKKIDSDNKYLEKFKKEKNIQEIKRLTNELNELNKLR